jgi:hypothetical protein
MASLGPFAAATQQDQHQRATTHRPLKPEIPGDHRCPQGACTDPPPPPPVTNESFAATTAPGVNYWLLLAGLTVALAAISSLNRK